MLKAPNFLIVLYLFEVDTKRRARMNQMDQKWHTGANLHNLLSALNIQQIRMVSAMRAWQKKEAVMTLYTYGSYKG